MTEDEAADLILSHRAHPQWTEGQPWRVAVEVTPYGDSYRDATAEECELLERVKVILGGNGSGETYIGGPESLPEPPSGDPLLDGTYYG